MNTRTWAEINLDSLISNVKEVRRITDPKAQVMAVVKADAYGHGVEECAKIFLENGADKLAVACSDEAVQLRREGIHAPILILGASFDEEIEAIVNNDIMPSVFDIEFAKKLSLCAKKNERTVKIHIKTYWLFLINTHESPGLNFHLNIVTRIPTVMSHM